MNFPTYLQLSNMFQNEIKNHTNEHEITSTFVKMSELPLSSNHIILYIFNFIWVTIIEF